MIDEKNNSDINNSTFSVEVPPNDFDAEQAVIGCMLFDTEGILVASEILNSDDFYRTQHKIVFDAILSLNSNDEPVDVITLKNKLETLGRFEQIGGTEYLISLTNVVSTSANVKYYSEIVKEKSIRRKLLDMAKQVQKDSFDNTKPIEHLINKAEKILENVSYTSANENFEPIDDILERILDRLEEVYKNKNKFTGLETGFLDFDIKTSGLQPSDFILIAARPSMGKTAFVLNIAQHICIKNQVPTVIFSLEMSKDQLINRIICSEGNVDAQRLKTGDIKDEDWSKISEAVGAISNSPIYIDDNSAITLAEIRAKCRKLKRDKNLGLIIIDYLQLMSSGLKNESRQQEISAISRSLKSLARELNVPIIALSQLSRAVEHRKPARPVLSDLRESGAIEQDADLVCFLYREEYYSPDTEKKGIAEVIISKQRNGAVGSLELGWVGKYTKFTNIERVYSNI